MTDKRKWTHTYDPPLVTPREPCEHDPDCHDPFCVEDELCVPCVCGHRLGAHSDYRCGVPGCRCKVFEARGEEPCPCCACNPDYKTAVPRRYASLAEEAHARARWDVFGCPNAKSRIDWSNGAKGLVVRYFDRREMTRVDAWLSIVNSEDGGRFWRKSHTARTWAWYVVIR